MPELREHPAVKSRRNFFFVDPTLIKIEPGFNVRDLDAPAAREGLDELKADIREHWVQAPIEVRVDGEDMFITHGHRRHKVVMELIAEGVAVQPIPAMAEPKGLSAVERKARIYTLNANEPLSPLEKAELVRWLLSEGECTREQVAAYLGVKTLAMVDRYLDMTQLPEPIREAVRNDEISATEAVNMVRHEGPLLAEQKLTEAKTAAKASGKKKVTGKSIAKVSAPRKSRGSAAPSAAVNKPTDAPKQQIAASAKVERALMYLREVIAEGVSPHKAAQGSTAQLADVKNIERWFGDFARELGKARGETP